MGFYGNCLDFKLKASQWPTLFPFWGGGHCVVHINTLMELKLQWVSGKNCEIRKGIINPIYHQFRHIFFTILCTMPKVIPNSRYPVQENIISLLSCCLNKEIRKSTEFIGKNSSKLGVKKIFGLFI